MLALGSVRCCHGETEGDRPGVSYIAAARGQTYETRSLNSGLFCIAFLQDLTVVNGYIHHTVYSFIVSEAVIEGQTSLFALCAVMELPTFFLALANTFPKRRNDWAFASTFLATRIMLHAWICWAYGVWVTEGFRISRTEAGIWELDTGKRGYQQWGGVFFIFLAFPL